ncbi:TPA: transcriptional regulator [Serratia fonticola]
MEYCFEGVIIYRPDDGLIYRISDPDTKTRLTLSVNRLLHYLVLQYGQVSVREDILKEVWEKHGLDPSNSSLNQNISLLRKIFSNYGIEGEIIKTAPKVGFFIPKEILITENGHLPKMPTRDKKTSQRKYISNKIVMIIYIFLLLAIIFSVYEYYRAKQSKLSVTPVGYIDSCTISIINFEKNSKQSLSNIDPKDLLETAGLSCTPKHHFYIYLEKVVNYERSRKLFIAKCLEDYDNVICNNYFFNDWGHK